MHIKCRNVLYPKGAKIQRLTVPNERVSWQEEWTQYNPPEYTDPKILQQPWADPDIDPTFHPKWNSLDDTIDRRSHEGIYEVVDGRPRNPHGRTGLRGRGCLGRWGPNHAADPIVTRWKPSGSTERRVLQFVAIQRKDCGEWALPGGMVDPGENVTTTLRREFMEEALNSLVLGRPEDAQSLVDTIFSDGREVYRGYVDDPRNTDNAWMETVAVNFHDEDGTKAGRLKLQAGDDAKNVKWMDADSGTNLYASHRDFLQKVVMFHKAHW